MIDPHCDRCGCEIEAYGALLISPPDVTDHGTTAQRHHICRHCYEMVFLPLLQDKPLPDPLLAAFPGHPLPLPVLAFPPVEPVAATAPTDPRVGKLTNEGADLLKDFAQSIGAMDSMPAWMRDEIEKKSTPPS